jgi:type IV pilus biogenesis protein CpaD/CtpE
MIRKTLAVLTVVLMTGCTSPSPDVTTHVHPSWPDPISKYDGKWQVKVIDGKPWVGMEFGDSQEFRVWLNDVSRYIKDANGMICYYRKDLKEPRCIK